MEIEGKMEQHTTPEPYKSLNHPLYTNGNRGENGTTYYFLPTYYCSWMGMEDGGAQHCCTGIVCFEILWLFLWQQQCFSVFFT